MRSARSSDSVGRPRSIPPCPNRAHGALRPASAPSASRSVALPCSPIVRCRLSPLSVLMMTPPSGSSLRSCAGRSDSGAGPWAARSASARAARADSMASTIVVLPAPFSPWNTVQSGCGCSLSSSIGPRFQITTSVIWCGCLRGASRSNIVLPAFVLRGALPAVAGRLPDGSGALGAVGAFLRDCPANIVQPVSSSSSRYSS